MHKQTKRSLLIISIAILLLSCSKNNSCINTTRWLKNGHRFIYKDNFPGSDDTMYVKYEEISSGIFKYIRTGIDTTIETVGFLQACGNSIYESGSPTMDPKIDAYRLTGSAGDTWNYQLSYAGNYSVKIVDPSVTLSVPAGTFTCIWMHHKVTEYSGSITKETDYFVNSQYGIIKANGTFDNYELISTNF